MLALLVLSIIVLIFGLLLLVTKKPAGKVITAIGVGMIVTFMFYFAFVSAGIYGKPGAETGYVLNILGLIILVLGAAASIYYIKKSRTVQPA